MTTLAECSSEIACIFEAMLAGKHRRSYLFLDLGFFFKRRNSSDTETLLRPFCLRLLITFLPPLVEILALKPSLRSLLNFLGWYVLFGIAVGFYHTIGQRYSRRSYSDIYLPSSTLLLYNRSMRSSLFNACSGKVSRIIKIYLRTPTSSTLRLECHVL